MTKELICFRCGKPIEGYLYVHTLSDENAHVYCQATGVKPNKQEKGENEMTKLTQPVWDKDFDEETP